MQRRVVGRWRDLGIIPSYHSGVQEGGSVAVEIVKGLV